MQLTRTADYAIRVMIHLSGLPPGARVSREKLADWAQVPGEFLAKVLQSLTRARLINSHRGSRGGFELARSASRISMLHIVEAVEGPTELNVCLRQDTACERSWRCAAHEVWKKAQSAMTEVLAGAMLDQLAVQSFRAPADKTKELTKIDPQMAPGRWK